MDIHEYTKFVVIMTAMLIIRIIFIRSKEDITESISFDQEKCRVILNNPILKKF